MNRCWASCLSIVVTFVFLLQVASPQRCAHAESARLAAEETDSQGESVRVTVENFIRAETDTYLGSLMEGGTLGEFTHERELTPIDQQTVIRMNRDTLYSSAVFDLDAGPVTLTLPETKERFMSIQVINQDHYTQAVFYAPGKYTLSKETMGTRYAAALGRTFVDPNDPSDMRAVHALQDAVEVEQAAAGSFEVPPWDQTSLKTMRDALNAVSDASGSLDSSRMFGRKDQVDPVPHLLGTAAGWGGNPPEAAMYIGVTPEQNDGETPYSITLQGVPVDGFWSVSVYNKDGFFEKNAEDSYTVNNVTAERSSDGSVTVHLGGDQNGANYIPITPGWNYLLRMYRPRKEVLDGSWTPPKAQIQK